MAIPLHNVAVGIADFTLEVCLLVTRDGALPLDPANATGLRSLELDSGVNNRPARPVLCSGRLFVAPAARRIRVPIHITQVPRG